MFLLPTNTPKTNEGKYSTILSSNFFVKYEYVDKNMIKIRQYIMSLLVLIVCKATINNGEII
jgi:hypothetical protein